MSAAYVTVTIIASVFTGIAAITYLIGHEYPKAARMARHGITGRGAAARHGIKGRGGIRGYVVVYEPGGSRRSRMAWWSFCAVRVAVPLGALALLPWAPLPAIALARGLGVVSIAAGSAVRPPGTAVTGWKDLMDWQPVDPACRLLTRSWPALGSLAEPRDIGPTVARARYEIATLLAARAALQKPLDELRDAPHGLAADDPLRTEVGAWGDELLARQRALTEQIGARIAALPRLAARTSEFAHEQAAAERARQALRRASTAAGTVTNLPTLDAVRDIDERTQAVFDAYRELTAKFTPAS